MAPLTSEGAAAAPRRLRVVHCFDTFNIGGTEMNAVRTIERLDRTRYDVSVLCLRRTGPLLQRVLDAAVPVEEFRIGSLVGWRALQQGVRLRRWLAERQVDVLHAHDVYTNIFAVPWARAAGVPLIIASRRWWVETNRGVHRAMNRWAYRLADVVLANSPSVGALVAAEGVPAGQIAVVPNFVGDDAFQPPPAEWIERMRERLGLGGTGPVVGIVANFHAIKDHATLLRATAELAARQPGLRVVLVGDGAERERLGAQARALGIESQVVMAGRLPPTPSPHWLFDVSTLVSRGEGFPNSIVEAMAAGRPLVATRVGGVPDVVVDGETGFLIEPGDALALARALQQLLSDRTLAARMGSAGAVRARSEYYQTAILARLDDLYSRAGRRKPPS
jgi:L-malate glycosyltransferase